MKGWAKRQLWKRGIHPELKNCDDRLRDFGVTLSWEGNQWVLCGRETERLGYSIKTEADALQFAWTAPESVVFRKMEDKTS